MPIARVIADPGTLEASLENARAALGSHGVDMAQYRLLEHEGSVLEIVLSEGNPGPIGDLLSEAFGPCDLLVSAAQPEIPHLLVSDMDSTMIGQECIDELADFAGLKDQVAAITERAMQGELDFEDALRERVGLLEGLSEDAISQCLAERIAPTPGAKTLVATLKARGCRCVLVTGGFHHFADAVAEQLGFDRVVGNRLAVADGKLTGGLVGPISDASTKKATLEEELAQLGESARTLALGDGANDGPMLQASDYGIAYYAKPAALKFANGRIARGDLTSVLKLVGVPESEWVTS